MEKLTQEELNEIIRLHKLWLENKPEGIKADLFNKDLSGLDLSNSDLRHANLESAYLSYANLRNANLGYANLRYANLRCASLKSANLESAILVNAYLRGADLRNADLRNAILINADLDFSAWPLWCGTKHVKLDKKLQAQLLAHAFQVSPDCPIYPDQVKFIKENFHQKSFFTRSN